ncbi:MAG: DUF4422 domain-containing protein [Lachnospiraceae bacterium]|nr:DUF4422 domain-containing protein [Lachnospiraceae bacterium]
MSVTIFTMTHKKFPDPRDLIYVPLHVGRAQGADYGYAGDDTGDNISAKNCYYGELTGVYWVWKNVRTTDYVGICHYRRYFCTEEGRIFNENDYLSILQDYDIITSKKLKLNYSYFDGYASDYNIFDLVTTGEVIRQMYPEYYNTFERLVHGNGTYFGNMMVSSKELYDEYAAWLFSIFHEVEKKIDPSGYDDYHKRVFGFISEFLLLVWTEVKGLKVYECKVGMTTEKYETGQMKEKLAEYFMQGDLDGAKEYFLSVLEKRPDVLMEASDITGELKLSMQVIAVCELERQEYGESVIDRICRAHEESGADGSKQECGRTDSGRRSVFDELMHYFSGLNDVVNSCKVGQADGEERRFLREHQVSDIAIEASARLFISEEKELEEVINNIEKYKTEIS